MSGGEQAADDSREAVRRRFKEALDRKNGKHAESAAAEENKDQSKIHDAHGPAHTQRQFRRKSGG
jgi:hypothetical protein